MLRCATVACLLVLTVEHDDRVAQVADPDLVDVRSSRSSRWLCTSCSDHVSLSAVDAARRAGLADDDLRERGSAGFKPLPDPAARFSLVGFSRPSISFR